MTTKFEFLPKTATADIAFAAYGKDADTLCSNAGLAVETVMVDLSTLKPKITMKVEIQGDDLPSMLFKFLDELVFLKDAKQMLFSKIEVKVNKTLKATLTGEKINPKTMKLGNDIKAITYHMYTVTKTRKGYEATVLVDV